jgi:hypothetical protein
VAGSEGCEHPDPDPESGLNSGRSLLRTGPFLLVSSRLLRSCMKASGHRQQSIKKNDEELVR